MIMSITAIPLMKAEITIVDEINNCNVYHEQVPVDNFFQTVKRLYETFNTQNIYLYGPFSYIDEQAHGIEKVLPGDDKYDIGVMADDRSKLDQRIQNEAMKAMQKNLGNPGQIITY